MMTVDDLKAMGWRDDGYGKGLGLYRPNDIEVISPVLYVDTKNNIVVSVDYALNDLSVRKTNLTQAFPTLEEAVAAYKMLFD